jgi:hypothetical protein
MTRPTLDALWGETCLHIILTGWPSAPRLTVGDTVVALEESSLSPTAFGGTLLVNVPDGSSCWWGSCELHPDTSEVTLSLEVEGQKPIVATARRRAEPSAVPAPMLPGREEGPAQQYTLPPIDGEDTPKSPDEFEGWAKRYITQALATFDEQNARTLAPYEALLVRTRQSDRAARQKLAAALHAGLADVRKRLNLPDPDWGAAGSSPGPAGTV